MALSSTRTPVNTGQFVMLPTPASLAFAERWNSLAASMIPQGPATQPALRQMHHHHFEACTSLCQCFWAHRNLTSLGLRNDTPIFRTYYPGYFAYTQSTCDIGNPAWVAALDPCDWQLLFLHPICATDTAQKEAVLRTAGFWFVDSEQGCEPKQGAASGVPACRPLQWRLPQTEVPHYACPLAGSLALVHGG